MDELNTVRESQNQGAKKERMMMLGFYALGSPKLIHLLVLGIHMTSR